MIRFLSRAATTVARTAWLQPISNRRSLFAPSSTSTLRLFHEKINGPNASPVALQMIDYALSLPKSQKSDESFAQAMLVLEQCLSSQSSEGQDIVTQNSKGMVLLAMSNLLFGRENYDEAMEKLQKIQDLAHSSLGVKVAAIEALVGLNLELGNDDTSSVLADKCLELLGKDEHKRTVGEFVVADARAKAVKGLVELVCGNLGSAESLFQGFHDSEGYVGNAALSYGEFLHATRNFSLAKDVYHKVINEVAENKDFSGMHTLASCNMASEEVLLAAICALGQLEAHMGKFSDAEETLTKALNKAEQHFGSRHPKVGVVLTCLALMFRQKAVQERSSSLLIQEGLYRRTIDLLKAPPLDSEGNVTMGSSSRRDVVALARGGYAETLCVQQNREREGERMKRWAEAAWKNNRFSLTEALKTSESSNKLPVIDARIGRVV
ncbi:hypothetical protein P3X46_004892 [Hevea brasiliensis]|uniref:MalT-like TPR region domain-containing protein n=1 Tax=Hevea brasiliensis TaxID=3981 RepID=A0ABQ9N000_HEVBR|nr:uncharacterized protein LOC110642886 isoform X2 [Hevea brasiliensis]KAJ9185235.1 hypothetical protein P3X46_004892 [Hevea brasiliensis]